MKPLKILSIRKNCLISKSSKIYPFSIITNSKINSFSYISYACKINNTTIGKFCSIAQNVKMGLGIHPINFISTSPLFYTPNNPLKYILSKNKVFNEHEPIIIGNDVWIGTNVTILDGVKIGDGAIIGAHSLVTKDIAPYTIVGGIPAKELKKRFSPEVVEELLDIKWWDYSIEKLKETSIHEMFSKEVDINVINDIKYLLKNT